MFTYPPKEQVDYYSLRLQNSERVRQHYQSVMVGVWVPCLQALVSSAAVSGLIALLCIQFKWSFVLVPGSFFIVFITTWLFRLSDWRQLIWSLENSLQLDINQDGVQGEPEPEHSYTLKVPILSADRRSGQFATFPASPRQMKYLGVQMMKPGASFSESYLCGDVISRKELSQIRAEMLARGLAVWRSPRDTARGIILTSGGHSCMKFFSSMTPEDIEPIQ